MKKFVLNMFMMRLLSSQSNFERSSPPALTVLLLLTGERQEEVEGGKNEMDGIPGVWALQGSFCWVPGGPVKVLGEMLGESLYRLEGSS